MVRGRPNLLRDHKTILDTHTYQFCFCAMSILHAESVQESVVQDVTFYHSPLLKSSIVHHYVSIMRSCWKSKCHVHRQLANILDSRAPPIWKKPIASRATTDTRKGRCQNSAGVASLTQSLPCLSHLHHPTNNIHWKQATHTHISTEYHYTFVTQGKKAVISNTADSLPNSSAQLSCYLCHWKTI